MLLIAPEAEQDLVDIWLFIAEDSPVNADNFIDLLHASAQQLAGFPLTGKLRPDLGDQLYMFPVERYLLFYQPLTGQWHSVGASAAFGARYPATVNIL